MSIPSDVYSSVRAVAARRLFVTSFKAHDKRCGRWEALPRAELSQRPDDVFIFDPARPRWKPHKRGTRGLFFQNFVEERRAGAFCPPGHAIKSFPFPKGEVEQKNTERCQNRPNGRTFSAILPQQLHFRRRSEEIVLQKEALACRRSGLPSQLFRPVRGGKNAFLRGLNLANRRRKDTLLWAGGRTAAETNYPGSHARKCNA